MSSIHTVPGFPFPMSGSLLLTIARGIGLSQDHHVLDICCRQGSVALLLAKELGLQATGLDPSESAIRSARSAAHDLGLAGKVDFLQMDPHHLELPGNSFDAVLALGGAPTLMGRLRALEQIRVLVVPGGWVLIADPVYLDSPPPADALELLRDLKDEDGRVVEPQPNPPGPVTRAILEEGQYSFETESGYRELLEATGYEVEFSVQLPESEWGEYFARAAREAGSKDAPDHDPDARIRAAQEAGAYYAYGGRGTVGYALIAARRGATNEG